MQIRVSAIILTTMFVVAGGLYAKPQAEKSQSADQGVPSKAQFYWLHTGEVSATFTNTGQIGDGFFHGGYYGAQCGGQTCLSFATPEISGIRYLFAGAIWIGGILGTDTFVSVGADGWVPGLEELFPPRDGGTMPDYGHSAYRALFADTFMLSDPSGYDPHENRYHKPLHLRMANRGHAWSQDPFRTAIIYDLVVTNIGSQPISEGYLGLMFDADVYYELTQYGYEDDVAGSLPDAEIGYVIDTDGDPDMEEYTVRSPVRCLAAKFLRSSFTPSIKTFNWWVSSGNPDYDFGPQHDIGGDTPQCQFGDHVGTPTGDRNKYCMLKNGEWDFDQVSLGQYHPGWISAPPPTALDITAGGDVRFMMSLGPFDLEPDSSIRVIFTTFTGDSVHTDPDNFMNNFVFSEPEAYLAGLDFSRVRASAEYADILADSILDPCSPVVGAEVAINNRDSVVIEWDPWVLPEVSGYNIYLQEVPIDSMPHPGILPPWYQPDFSAPIETVGPTYHYPLLGLEQSHIYFGAVSNKLTGKSPALSLPFSFQVGGRHPAPLLDDTIFFYHDSEPVTIHWREPEGVNVASYSIYRFDDSTSASKIFYPFYDTGEAADSIAPVESTLVNEIWYYYYAPNPYAQVDSGTVAFNDFSEDSTIYVVTAVDKLGLESSFSQKATIFKIPTRTKEVLVVTGRYKHLQDSRAVCDSIVAFYESVLLDIPHDIYIYYDSVESYPQMRFDDWWYALMPYKLVIFDGGMENDIPHIDLWSETVSGIEKYLVSGGRIAYFGSFHGRIPFNTNSHPQWRGTAGYGLSDYFGLDSIFQIGFLYYAHIVFPEPQQKTDALVGMISADCAWDTIPDIVFDTLELKKVIGTVLYGFWPSGTAPAPAVFVPSEGSEVTHRLKSIYPATSLVDGRPIGIKKITDSAIVYCFGFHLWYMDRDDARELINYIAGDLMTATDDPNPGTVPLTIELKQNHPNPFNPTTTIEFTLPRQGHVTLAIYNILGQKIRTLLDYPRPAGRHQVFWDGRDGSGKSVASGIYFYRLEAGQDSESMKMVLLK